jgi:hypothetical protein
MFGFLIGWGVFLLLTWAVVTVLGLFARMDSLAGWGILGTLLSAIYLIAVFVGRAVGGI